MFNGVKLMKKLYYILAIMLCVGEAFAQGGPGVGPAPGVQLQDEGTGQGRVQILNCTGAGITCSKSGVTGTLNVTGGAGSSNGVVVSINLGTGGGLIYTVTVTGQAWVTATSAIACTPFGTTADGLTPETVMASGVQAVTSAYVVGTGFNLSVYTPHGATGTYRFGCTGV
jgi:hypothetical protein